MTLARERFVGLARALAAILRSTNIDPSGIRHQTIYCQHEIYFAATRQRARHDDIELIESGKVALRASVEDLGIQASDLDAHRLQAAAIPNSGAEEQQHDLLSLRREFE